MKTVRTARGGNDDHVGIIGGGLGGLSAACTLAARGYRVTLFEKNEWLGGKAAVLEEQGFRFDMGPSWYWMPDLFERFFGSFDREVPYGLTRLDLTVRSTATAVENTTITVAWIVDLQESSD